MTPAAPHVMLVVADDMGYSDRGCYGGERLAVEDDVVETSDAHVPSLQARARETALITVDALARD